MSYSKDSAIPNPPPIDDVFAILANDRRRMLIRTLEMRSESELTLTELAAELCQLTEPTETERRKIAVTLHHVHLPMLAALDVLEYDAERRVITPNETLSTLESYLPE